MHNLLVVVYNFVQISSCKYSVIWKEVRGMLWLCTGYRVRSGSSASRAGEAKLGREYYASTLCVRSQLTSIADLENIWALKYVLSDLELLEPGGLADHYAPNRQRQTALVLVLGLDFWATRRVTSLARALSHVVLMF